MNKAPAIFLILFGLIALSKAAEHVVNVGTKEGKNRFEPYTVNAAVGDTVRFVWVSGKHSVIESDAKRACSASKAPNAFTTEVYEAPKEWVLDIKDASGQKWFYCGVPQHCANGMVGTILIDDGPSKTPPKTPTGPSPKTKTGFEPTPASSAQPFPFTIFIVIGSMLGGSLLTAGIFFLYRWNKKKSGKGDAESLTNIPNDRVIINDNEPNNEVIDNEIRTLDNEVYNNEQEAIRNIDSEVIQRLKNEMTQIIRQEIKNLK
ncbi:13669_t:CDS:2 [Funneliformis caledonium]|uniref:13669_t:CDS:1 n=1 Tax=Funneliformis caledonium TaxID=1117310 RepID=A0A9N9BPF9_9GLOM|nr:13669_t:CDS:2 [Funneliformis caledonium]